MKKLHINVNDKKSVINKNIYGHFAEHLGRCIYNGIFVGEGSDIPNEKGMRTDIVEALRNIKIPVLRWPGGCFADEYHWKDGIGPKENRKRMINTHWGGVVEDNSFGTHEFMELCRQLDCEPYINGNVGSGTVQEMSEWVEYLTFDGVSPMAELRKQNGQEKAWKVKYWGVGNENWGCGGNMRPEFYADLYRQFQTYVRNYDDNKIHKIACGANAFDYNWTDVVMKMAGRYMNALTVHYYTLPTGNWSKKGSATGFGEDEYYATLYKALKIDELLTNHIGIMDRYDPEKRVDLIVDEWGTWYDVEPGTNPGFLFQQNSMRDAMVASLTFDIFHKFADRVRMANIAQTINVLQAMVLTEGDKMVLTPTYHVYDLYKCHHDATNVYTFFEAEQIGTGSDQIPNFSATASIGKDGGLNISMTNTSADTALSVEICLEGMDAKKAAARILTGNIGDHNRFEDPEKVKITDFNGIEITDGKLYLTMPACSVITATVS
ncbi:MAG: alpha-N-arabinofuranosidase [Firmicutes bacterium]|nr:alpha-N-arabinofuranosidase [Bacillota bacterium]